MMVRSEPIRLTPDVLAHRILADWHLPKSDIPLIVRTFRVVPLSLMMYEVLELYNGHGHSRNTSATAG
jgi:hypothetical protein